MRLDGGEVQHKEQSNGDSSLHVSNLRRTPEKFQTTVTLSITLYHLLPCTPFSRAVNIRSVQTAASTQAHRAQMVPVVLAVSSTAAGSVVLSVTSPPPCVPSLPAHYRRFLATMDALTPVALSSS